VREDIITKMRSDISVRVVSEFGSPQDLQAFRITYSGKDARLVSMVAQQLASLFIEENLSARELQATGTTDFLTNQLQETRKQLEQQEAKLKDFKLKHIGEMPEQQSADLQLVSQAQSQLQQEADALARAEQQRSYLQSMLTQTASVVDMDERETNPVKAAEDRASRAPNELAVAKAKLASLLSHYTESHPDVQKLKAIIQDEEARQAQAAKEAAANAPPEPAPAAPVKRTPRPPSAHFNPVLESQLKTLDAEIAKHNEEQQRLSKLVSVYRAKLDAIPVREQEITELQRDYEISKNHYKQLLDNQLAAQTATQLEYRQKGEKFEVLDPATPAERPTRPNRMLINMVGTVAGLVLGLVLATGKEFLGMTIITAQDAVAASSLPLLGEIPVIQTRIDRRRRNRWILAATTSGLIAALAGGALLLYYNRIQM
jgi:succinoglycan biosynthesis transport protein ExoP